MGKSIKTNRLGLTYQLRMKGMDCILAFILLPIAFTSNAFGSPFSPFVIQHPSLNGNAVGYIPYPPNDGLSSQERIETSHNIASFFSNVCTKAGRSQYPSLCHRIHESKERGYGFPLWVAKKRDGKEEQEVTQPRTIRDKQFNPWAGKRKRGDNYNPWAGKRSDAQFNPWAGKKRDDKIRTDRAATIKALRLTKRGLLSEIASTLDGDTTDDFEDIID